MSSYSPTDTFSGNVISIASALSHGVCRTRDIRNCNPDNKWTRAGRIAILDRARI